MGFAHIEFMAWCDHYHYRYHLHQFEYKIEISIIVDSSLKDIFWATTCLADLCLVEL